MGEELFLTWTLRDLSLCCAAISTVELEPISIFARDAGTIVRCETFALFP
jgi:hypothetical protein